MKNISVTGTTLPETYHKALYNLHKYGDITDCADWHTTQKELMMTMTVLHPLKEPMISKFFIGGPHELEQYRQEMLDGILDFEVGKGNWKYTYHNRMTDYWIDADDYVGYRDQIKFVIDELKRNPSSRRAVIDIRDNAEDMYSSEPACLQHIQYFIRNNKLDCMVLFRSNDAVEATFMNAFALIMLQKRIADELGIEVGTYTHTANSFHCYEKNFKQLDAFCDRVWSTSKYKIGDAFAYNYVGDWDEMMEEEKEIIKKKVEKLKHEA